MMVAGKSLPLIIVAGIAVMTLIPGLLKAENGVECAKALLAVQVLGSGGPELDDGRASSGYLVWRNGHARLLIDLGPGSLLRFEQSGAQVEDIDAVLLSHLHVDHAADLPALIKGSFFSARDRDLPIYGPTGSALMPATEAFVQTLFGAPGGAFHYLSDYLEGGESYRLLAHDVDATGRAVRTVRDDDELRITAVPVHHGPIPALAWRVDVPLADHDRSVVFSGDMNGDNHTLAGFARGADLLIAHHAIPEHAGQVARNLHMPPSVIGEIAAAAGIGQLVLSHRMTRTQGREDESRAAIRRHYQGPMTFANDGDCYPL